MQRSFVKEEGQMQRRFVRELPDTPCVVVTTTHGGNGRRTGGQYGYGYDLYPTRRGVVVAYWSTAAFDYCPHYGGFVSEDECERRGHRFQLFPWRAAEEEFDYVAVQAARQLLRRQAVDVDDDVYVDKDGNVFIDATGHEPVGCQYDGGCIICYPCNHAPCMAELEEENEEEV